MKESEIRELANKTGFAVETDNEGQLVLYTGVYGNASESPYKNGPYLVLSDGSTFDGAEGCYVAYVTDEAEKELTECSDFNAVEEDQVEIISISDLMDAYNIVYGTEL